MIHAIVVKTPFKHNKKITVLIKHMIDIIINCFDTKSHVYKSLNI